MPVADLVPVPVSGPAPGAFVASAAKRFPWPGRTLEGLGRNSRASFGDAAKSRRDVVGRAFARRGVEWVRTLPGRLVYFASDSNRFFVAHPP
jgi:hypothetical protein